MSKPEITGFYRKDLYGTDYDAILRELDKLSQDGWEIHKAKYTRRWPYFWIKDYKVKLRNYFVVVDDEIVHYSKKEIERVKAN